MCFHKAILKLLKKTNKNRKTCVLVFIFILNCLGLIYFKRNHLNLHFAMLN